MTLLHTDKRETDKAVPASNHRMSLCHNQFVTCSQVFLPCSTNGQINQIFGAPNLKGNKHDTKHPNAESVRWKKTGKNIVQGRT